MANNTIRKEYGLYGSMTKAQKLDLVGGWLDGATVYYRTNPDDAWQQMGPAVSWVDTYYYMLEFTLPTVSWDCVSSNWGWLSVDADGTPRLHSATPVYLPASGTWQSPAGAPYAPISAKYFASYDRGNTAPADSLYSR